MTMPGLVRPAPLMGFLIGGWGRLLVIAITFVEIIIAIEEIWSS